MMQDCSLATAIKAPHVRFGSKADLGSEPSEAECSRTIRRQPITITAASARGRHDRDHKNIEIAFAVAYPANGKQRYHSAIVRQAVKGAGAHHGDPMQ